MPRCHAAIFFIFAAAFADYADCRAAATFAADASAFAADADIIFTLIFMIDCRQIIFYFAITQPYDIAVFTLILLQPLIFS